MSSIVFQNGLLGFFRLLTTTIVAGWVGSPMSWSPDSQWLSYTVAPGSERDAREPGWLFDTTRDIVNPRDRSGPTDSKGPPGPISYRIWATHRDAESSVLIEESAWPLTSPSWSPHGRSIAFGRFVPASIEPNQSEPRGRIEVVIQDGLERKQAVLTVADFELDPEARAEFPHAVADWSPDGQFLAFSKPGRSPAILIFKVESRKLLHTIEHAARPAWSPDGSKLAFIRNEVPEENSLQVLERHGPSFLAARPVIAVSRVKAAPSWTGDGRSIIVVAERARARPSEVDLMRVFLETGESLRVLPLAAPDLMQRVAPIRGIAIDYQREEERCFFAVDFQGRDTEVVWSVPRDRITVKRFHPVDGSLRIGSLAVSPDGRFLALRFGPPSSLTLPAIQDVHDAATDQVSLVTPDEAARGSWLTILSRTARALLLDGLPPASADGHFARRPTLLPLPGEIPAQHPLLSRLARLGRIGSAACSRPRQRNADDGEPDVKPATTPEDRLFFNYLRGDFAAAASDLGAVEPRIVAPQQRLSLLSLQAQILYSKGDTTGARAIVDYLISAEGGPIHRIEETPLGRVLTAEPDPGQIWARYLASRMIDKEAAAPSASPAEVPADHLPNPFAPAAPLEIERDRGGGAPFVPFAPGFDPQPIRRGGIQQAPAEDRPPPRPQPIGRGRRRKVQ
jgi:Tol biopolymer transport system component